MAGGPRRLTDRALNRALLARQLLLERSSLGAVDAVEHLVGVQAQTPFTPYVSLWSRLEGFSTDDLATALLEHQVVRIATLRSTIHLHSVRDAREVRPLVNVVGERMLQSSRGKGLAGLDLEAVGAAAREVLAAEPMTLSALGERLAPRWPDRDPEHLGMVARVVLPLVQPPPRGVWGRSGGAVHTTLAALTGKDVVRRPSLKQLVLRYLAAYGPAEPRDMQVWCGLTRLTPAFEALRPELVTFEGPDGHELFDLPDAPRPGADVPAPIRFLGDLDDVWLSHHDRARVVDPSLRKSLMSSIGASRGTVLVDGRVSAMWRVRSTSTHAALGVEPLVPLRKKDEREVRAEAERLLAFLAPDAPSRDITLTTLP